MAIGLVEFRVMISKTKLEVGASSSWVRLPSWRSNYFDIIICNGKVKYVKTSLTSIGFTILREKSILLQFREKSSLSIIQRKILSKNWLSEEHLGRKILQISFLAPFLSL